MSLSMTDTCEKLAELIEGIEGTPNVYRPSTNGKRKLPDAVVALPAVLVIPDETIEYVLSNGMQRHTYEVKLLVMHRGGDSGFAAANVLPYLDRVIGRFEVNVKLGMPHVTSCVFVRQSGLVNINWGGIDYPGWSIFLRVSEEASASPAPGVAT